MNKNIILTLIALVAVAALIFAFSSKGENMEGPNGQQESAEKETPMSMKDLVAKNEPTRCTFTHATDINSSEGVVYIAEGKIYGDFDIVAQGTSLKAYMITDGEYSYTWSSMLPQGFKIALADIEQTDSNDAGSSAEGISYTQALDYDCEPWTADLSVFTPPANITFLAPGEFPQMPSMADFEGSFRAQ